MNRTLLATYVATYTYVYSHCMYVRMYYMIRPLLFGLRNTLKTKHGAYQVSPQLCFHMACKLTN